MEMIKDAFEMIQGTIMQYGMKVITCIILLLIGLKVIGSVCKHVKKAMEKKGVDVTIIRFTNSLLKISLRILLVLAILQTLDAEVTSFVAILAAASFAIGMALQGSLSNFAAGVIIILLKPFKIGDFVEISGMSGVVSSIQVFSTILKTLDNKTVILPNGPIIASSITNYSVEENRRVDFVFGIDYSADIRKAKDIMREVALSHKLVLEDPDVFVGVSELGDSSVNFAVRVWVKAEDYWTVYFDITEAMKLRLDKENIGIPYPHIQLVKD